MAARKSPVETPEPTPYDLGLGSEDVQLPRLRVVGKLSKLVDAELAKSGDIAIGASAEDTESEIISALNGKESIRIYVLNIHSNYACPFKAVQDNPELAGSWEDGDPTMPPEAKRQHNLTLCIPQHSTFLPVIYTASGTAAREVRNGVTMKLYNAAQQGTAPYTMAFDMTTKIYTGGNFSWPGPVFKLVEPIAAEVEIAQRMHDDMGFGVRRAQLETSSGDSTPTPTF